jgi:hypothetical protein
LAAIVKNGGNGGKFKRKPTRLWHRSHTEPVKQNNLHLYFLCVFQKNLTSLFSVSPVRGKTNCCMLTSFSVFSALNFDLSKCIAWLLFFGRISHLVKEAGGRRGWRRSTKTTVEVITQVRHKPN